jgi:DNA-binding MarR family transcriptional regulator
MGNPSSEKSDPIDICQAAARYVVSDSFVDLTIRQVAILGYVSAHPHTNPSVIAGAFDMSRPVVSKAIDKLVKRGIMIRIASSHDRRRVIVALTPEGFSIRELMQQLCAAAAPIR